jgi:hypothetical protein
MTMIKAEFGFFQVQVEGSGGYAVKLLQPAFGITPERFNAIDVMLTSSELVRTMIHPKVFIKTNIHQAVLAAPAVRMNHPIGCNMSPDHPLQRGFGAIRHNPGIDSAIALQQSKHNRFAVCTPATLASNTARTKVRFTNFNRTLQRGLLLTHSSNTSPEFQVNAVHRAHRNTGQCCRIRGRKIHGKTAQKLPEFLLANSGTAVVSIFNIHLSKLAHFNQCLTS